MSFTNLIMRVESWGGSSFPPARDFGVIGFYLAELGAEPIYKCLVSDDFPDRAAWEEAVFEQITPHKLKGVVNGTELDIVYKGGSLSIGEDEGGGPPGVGGPR